MARLPYRRPLRAFLYIHGPDIGGAVCGVLALAAFWADFALQPHGFTRFAFAVVRAYLQGHA